MCVFNSPKAPALPPKPAPAPRMVDEGVQNARNKERNAAKAAAGVSSTILTGSQGLLDNAKTKKKVLLGA